MFIYMLLGTAILIRLNKKFGNYMTYLWVFALCFIYPVVLPFSLQYSSVFFIAMAGVFATDKMYKEYNLRQTGILFLILGILTSYFDFLTAPLLTLGIPLIYLMLLIYYQYEKLSLRKNMLTLIWASVTWGMGYLGCWCMKWIIASPILGRNVVLDGISSVKRRTFSAYHMKTLDYDTGVLRSIEMNLFAILPPGITSSDWRWFSIVILMIVLVLAVIFIKYHVEVRDMKQLLPFVLISFYPFIWLIVASQHSSIHFGFTYRIELISLLGFLIAYSNSIKYIIANKSASTGTI